MVSVSRIDSVAHVLRVGRLMAGLPSLAASVTWAATWVHRDQAALSAHQVSVLVNVAKQRELGHEIASSFINLFDEYGRKR